MAQQYPIGTGNGGPYTPGQSYYPPYQQKGMQQPAYTPQDFPQPQMSPQGGYNPSNGVNIGRFEPDAQIHASGPSFQFHPSTFGSDIFRQFANPAAIPPPIPPPQYVSLPPQSRFGFPSLSTPTGGIPASGFPQFNSDGYSGSNITLSNTANQSRGFPPMINGQGIHTDAAGIQGNEMDLSEGEIDRIRLPHTAPQDHFHLANMNILQTIPSSHTSRLNVHQTPDFSLQSGDNIANGTPPHSNLWSNNSKISIPGAFQAPKDFNSTPNPHERVSAQVNAADSPYDSTSVHELRQLTKDALLSLYSQEVRFQHLIAEGLDLEILLQLYEELGIQVPGFTGRISVVPTNTQPEPEKGSINEAPTQDPRNRAVINETVAEPSRVQSTANQVDQSSLPSSKQPKISLHTSRSPQLDEVDSSLPNISTTSKPPPTISPSMERKDRIAQLLAAKTGRPSPAHESPESPSASASAPFGSAPGIQRDFSLRESSDDLIQKQKGHGSVEGQSKLDGIPKPTEQSKPGISAGGSLDQYHLLTVDTIGNNPAALNTAVEPSSLAPWSTLSTPSREELERSSFINSIPGLFMTSADSFNGDKNIMNSIKTLVSHDSLSLRNAESDSSSKLAGHLQSDDRSANDVPTQPLTKFQFSTTHVSSKRPLASDTFEDMTEPESKRPNIQSPEQEDDTGVDTVEVDDASEGEIVETDEYNVRNPIIHGMHVSRSQIKPGSNLQRTESFPEKNTYQPTPPRQTSIDDISIPTSSDIPNRGLYRAKQSEIEEMRKKIAEMELRKQLKRTVSRTDSPQPPISSSPLNTGILQAQNKPSPKSEAVTPVGEVINIDAQTKPPQPKSMSKLTPAQLAQKAAALKAGLLKQRANRQKVLQDGLPELNTEVQNTKDKLTDMRVKLEQIRQDAQRYEADALRARELERQALLDATRLEQQLRAGISGQKQFSDELQSLENETQLSYQHKRRSSTEGKDDMEMISTNEDGLETPQSFGNRSETSNGQNQVGQDCALQVEAASRVDLSVTTESSRKLPNSQYQSPDDIEKINSIEIEDDRSDLPDPVSSDAKQTAELSVDYAEKPGIMTALPDVQTSDESEKLSRQSSMDIDENSEGSVSMSDSGSDEEEEEYEPIDTEREYVSGQISDELDSGSEEYDPEEVNVEDGPASDVLDDDETGEYDPAENMDPIQENLFDSSIPVIAIDLSTTSGTQVAPVEDTESNNLTSPLPEVIATAVKTNGANIYEADNSTNQMIPSATDKATENETNPVPSMPLSGEFVPGTARYIPYQSPLQSFRSFRFHPRFNDIVKDGYRSLTYSNSIDWKLPLCPTELAGETCTDPDCEEQHFRQLGLTDDKILVQMSSTNDIKEKSQRDRYLVGLKQVIASLRQNGVKEFENVANALSTYRREFFAEPEPS